MPPPVDLTADELAEYERQRKELESEWYHDAPKCGRILRCDIYLEYKKYTETLSRKYCWKHKVVLNGDGSQLGYDVEGPLSRMNPKKQVYPSV
jgi:hypothetical protein